MQIRAEGTGEGTEQVRRPGLLARVLGLAVLLVLAFSAAQAAGQSGAPDTSEGSGAQSEPLPPVRADAIIVEPSPPGMTARIWTPRRRYRPGDLLEISLFVSLPAYVYVYNLDSAGNVRLLFPNRFDTNNRLPAGEHTLPRRGYRFRIGGPGGPEYLQLVATSRPLRLVGPSAFLFSPFPRLDGTPADVKRRVEASLKAMPDEWAVAWTGFYVVPAPPSPLRPPVVFPPPPGPGPPPPPPGGPPPAPGGPPGESGGPAYDGMPPGPDGSRPPVRPTGPPQARLGLSVGVDGRNVWSVGLEGGGNTLVVGGSVRFTGDPFHPQDQVRDLRQPTDVRPNGPEWELFLKLGLPLSPELALETSLGAAVQPRAEVERSTQLAPDPGPAQRPGRPLDATSAALQRSVEEFQPWRPLPPEIHVTWGVGIRLDGQRLYASVGWHNRRGIIGLIGMRL